MGLGDMLQAQQDAEDARRYRWLKSHIAVTIIQRINPSATDLREQALDHVIDLKIERRGPTVTGESQ